MATSSFFRWTSVNAQKKQRSGYKFEGGQWFKVHQVGLEKPELKPVKEYQVPGSILDEARACPLLGAA